MPQELRQRIVLQLQLLLQFGRHQIYKERKLRLSRQHCNLKGRNLLNRGNTTTDIADKVILGKEISKSV